MLTPIFPPLSCFPLPYVVLAHGTGHDSGSPGKNRKEGWGKKSWRGPRAGADANQQRLDPPPAPPRRLPAPACPGHPSSIQFPFLLRVFSPFFKGFFNASVPPSRTATAGCSQRVSPAALPVLPFRNLSYFLGIRILEVLGHLKKRHPDEGVQGGKNAEPGTGSKPAIND